MFDPLARLRAFPKAPPPNDNPSAIRGNISLESKQLCANILAYHVAHYPGSTVFANEALRELKAVEVNVMKTAEGESKKETLKCEAIFETPVLKESLNVHGTLSGGFAAHMLDVCLFGVLFSLGIETGFDASGVSTAMDLNWYSPGLPGMTLKVIASSVILGSKVSASRAEVYDKKSGRLLITATQNIAPFRQSKL